MEGGRDGRSPEGLRVSAILVALGDDPDLPRCLAALSGGDPPPFEAIVVENGATGPGPKLPDWVRHRLRRSRNPGFAGGVEDGLALAAAPYVLTLNPDAWLEPGALRRALSALEEDPGIGAVALRLLRPDRATLDSAGIRMGVLNRPRDRGMGRPAEGLFPAPEDVDAACMAAALFRRSALDGARDGRGDVVDRSFFAYREDADLGWRLRRAGYRIRYEPAAVAIHRRGWREGMRNRVPERLRILSIRNRWLTILKNEPLWLTLLKMAIYAPAEALFMLRLLFREPRVLAAYPMIVRAIPDARRRRRLLKGQG